MIRDEIARKRIDDLAVGSYIGDYYVEWIRLNSVRLDGEVMSDHVSHFLH